MNRNNYTVNTVHRVNTITNTTTTNNNNTIDFNITRITTPPTKSKQQVQALATAEARGKLVWTRIMADMNDVFDKGEDKTVVTVSGNTTDRVTTVDLPLPLQDILDLMVYVKQHAEVLVPQLPELIMPKKRKREVVPDEKLARIRWNDYIPEEEKKDPSSVFRVVEKRVVNPDLTEPMICLVCEKTQPLRHFHTKVEPSISEDPAAIYGKVRNICLDCLTLCWVRGDK